MLLYLFSILYFLHQAKCPLIGKKIQSLRSCGKLVLVSQSELSLMKLKQFNNISNNHE